MIDRLIGFVQGFDLPTVVFSVIVGFLLKAVWDVLSAGLKRRRQSIRDDLQWYRELRALARKIAIAYGVTKTFTNKFDVDEDDVKVQDGNSEDATSEGAAEFMNKFLEDQRDAAYGKHLTEMEVLYEELLSHVATADVDLGDEMEVKIENLIFHTFMSSMMKFEVPESYQMPAEELSRTIVEMCDEEIEELETELPFWRSVLSRIV